MWFSVSEHLAVTLYSVIMGAFLGVIYDCVKLTRILAGIGSYSRVAARLYRLRLPVLREKRAYLSQKEGNGTCSGILMFFGDIVYALIAAGCYSLFLFHAIRGQVRWYFILASAVGFFIYYFTVSKFALTVLEVIMFCVRAVMRYVIELVILPVRLICKVFVRISNIIRVRMIAPVIMRVKYKSAVKYTEKIRLRLSGEVQFQ